MAPVHTSNILLYIKLIFLPLAVLNVVTLVFVSCVSAQSSSADCILLETSTEKRPCPVHSTMTQLKSQ